MIARNALANAIGMVVVTGVQVGLSFGAYRLAGPEQFGLVGLYTTAMTAAAIFDIGLGQTLVREVARRRTLPREDPGGVRPVTFNFLLLYLGLAVFLAVGIAAVSPWVARYWVHPEKLTPAEITNALILIGLAVAVQRVRGVFQSALDGLEKQVTTNTLLIVTSLIRLALGLGALLFVQASAFAFFCGQALASLIETVMFGVVATRSLPPSDVPHRFNPKLIAESGRFIVVNAASAGLGTGLQIADSLIISAALPLAVFGNYSLVSQMCTVILRLTQPILGAAYPRVSAYVREERIGELKSLIFGYSQVSTILLATATFALVQFGGPMLSIVSGHPNVGRDFALVLATLAAAYASGGFSRCVHVLMMAEGFPGIALKINLAMAPLYLPAIIFLTPRYGVIAPAACLLIGNLGSFAGFIFTGFRHRLKGHAAEWVWAAIIPQTAVIGAVYLVARLAADSAHVTNDIALTAIAVLASLVALAGGALVSRDVRPLVLGRLRSITARLAR